MKDDTKVTICYEICGHPVEFESGKEQAEVIKAYYERLKAMKEGKNHEAG